MENISRGAQAVPAPAPSRPTRLSEAETQAARDRVMAPAISLTILSGLLILFAVLIGLAAIGVSVWYGSSRRGSVLWYGWWFPSGEELDMWKRLISLALIQIPLLPFGLIMFVGALRMRRLESYGLALTASYVSALLGGLDLLISSSAALMASRPGFVTPVRAGRRREGERTPSSVARTTKDLGFRKARGAVSASRSIRVAAA